MLRDVTPAVAAVQPPSPWLLLRVWLTLGVQSFGGGTATLVLIRRAVVEQQGWLSEAEFSRAWTLVQVAPGINLLALTILVGRRVGGAPGIALSLLGLLLPSAAIAVLLTAFYAHIQQSPWVQAALRGMIPATVGLGLLTAFQIARPFVLAGHREGRAGLSVSVLVLIGSAAAAIWGRWPVILILVLGGVISAAASWRRHSARTETGAPE